MCASSETEKKTILERPYYQRISVPHHKFPYLNQYILQTHCTALIVNFSLPVNIIQETLKIWECNRPEEDDWLSLTTGCYQILELEIFHATPV